MYFHLPCIDACILGYPISTCKIPMIRIYSTVFLQSDRNWSVNVGFTIALSRLLLYILQSVYTCTHDHEEALHVIQFRVGLASDPNHNASRTSRSRKGTPKSDNEPRSRRPSKQTNWQDLHNRTKQNYLCNNRTRSREHSLGDG